MTQLRDEDGDPGPCGMGDAVATILGGFAGGLAGILLVFAFARRFLLP